MALGAIGIKIKEWQNQNKGMTKSFFSAEVRYIISVVEFRRKTKNKVRKKPLQPIRGHRISILSQFSAEKRSADSSSSSSNTSSSSSLVVVVIIVVVVIVVVVVVVIIVVVVVEVVAVVE